MISPYIFAGIACAVFLFIFSLRIKAGRLFYSFAELAIFYALMRIAPLMMYENHGLMNVLALAEDFVILAAGFFLSKKQLGVQNAKLIAAVYLFNPLAAAAVITGHFGAMALLPLAYTIVYGAGIILRQKKPLFDAKRFFPEYIWICAGGYFMMLADDCLLQKTTDMFFGENYPTLLVTAMAVVVTGVVLTIRKLRVILREDKPAEKTAAPPEAALAAPEEPQRWNAKNTIAVIALTAGYAAAALFNLGAASAPSSGMHFGSGEGEACQVVIDLGEYTALSEVSVFLGRESKRAVSLCALDESTNEWTDIVSKYEIPSPYQWNDIPINLRLRCLRIEFLDSSADVLEVVLKDDSGRTVSPVSAEKFPALFDEQELYPEYPTYFYGTMFDEVYHGRTAYEFMNDLPIYENTHPPLGKTIISAGIALFGMNPFGWRIMCVVFGTAMVPLMYAFAWRLSKRRGAAFLGGFLTATEFMHFTLSRIATIDIIVGCFILMMFFFMYLYIDETRNGAGAARRYALLLLCGVSMGLACATKWTGAYAALGIAILFFVFLVKHCKNSLRGKELFGYLLRLFAVCAVCFIAVPAVIYVSSYFEFAQVYTDKNILQHALENAQYMLGFHKSALSGHPYSSEWYEWIIDSKPLLDALTETADNHISSVATFVNPLVAWGGIAALLHNIYLWRIREDTKAQYLVISYLAMLMPWLFIHRTVFIYQYFACVPLLILMVINSVINLKAERKLTTALIAVSGALFLMFYPVLSGLNVPREYIGKVLEWLTTWRFE